MSSSVIPDFRRTIQEILPKYDLILNTDESAMNYEIYCPRTLSMKGEKDTLCNVGSLSDPANLDL
ncbi:hypothetical protein SNEBB_006956, partial [Seison nebaliae]